MLSYAASQGSSSGGLFSFLLIAVFFVAIYFLMIRPQQKRRRDVQSMQSAMDLGDEVVTVGGLYGTIRSIDEDTVNLEISPGVTAKYARAAIGKVNKKADSLDEEVIAEPASDSD